MENEYNFGTEKRLYKWLPEDFAMKVEG